MESWSGVELSLLYSHVIWGLEFGVELGNKSMLKTQSQ